MCNTARVLLNIRQLFVQLQSVVTHAYTSQAIALVKQWQVKHERAVYKRSNKPIQQSLERYARHARMETQLFPACTADCVIFGFKWDIFLVLFSQPSKSICSVTQSNGWAPPRPRSRRRFMTDSSKWRNWNRQWTHSRFVTPPFVKTDKTWLTALELNGKLKQLPTQSWSTFLSVGVMTAFLRAPAEPV